MGCMQHFDAATTRAALTFDALVPALKQAFASPAQVPARHVHAIEQAGQALGTLLIMPAWNDSGFLGIKTISIFPGNNAHGLPGLHASYLLHDARTGVPLALMDGNEITAHRTAAAAALGAQFLARDDAQELLVLGTGRVARLLPAAMRSVRPGLQRVRLWNHRPQSARALAEQWRQQGLDAQAVTDLEAAVRQADIVSCATLASSALVHGDWLAPGSHLDLIGSFTPHMREADPACFGPGRQVYIDTEEALAKAGDLLDAMAAGTLSPSAIGGTLAQLCRGERRGRTDAAQRTVFKAVGSALEDLCAAMRVWAERPSG